MLNEKLGMGLTGVSLLMSALLAVVLVVQFRTKAYRAGVYWLARGPDQRRRHAHQRQPHGQHGVSS